MRCSLAIMVAGILLSLGAGTAVHAQNTDSTFNLTICNKTSTLVRMMFFHPEGVKDMWMLSGWYQIKPSSCSTFEQLPRGYFYWFAKQDGEMGLVWEGTKRHLCTSTRATWRKVFPNEQCLVGETNRGFSELLAKSPSESINLAGP
uniref:DUF1036 domain-containing protein n=1 Tax=Rhodopseudomonas palustris (strain DX-1) TaxID=652103 RepID=E6VP74_RHOPX